MSRESRLAVVVLALFAVVIAVTGRAVSSELRIELQRGANPVTWNGAEPYPIGNFEDTPVTQIHRWDAVGQQWLSRFVGQDGATLPELHLLPRVQYLLIAETTYDLTAPDPLAGIDPHAALRYAAAPDDPLRFEAYWPNEDSPLEDLVVLRGEDERLSVRAEVSGGVGDTNVYWVIDGRINHAGLASDDVDLTPGAHDYGRLLATDKTGQVAVAELPRVVKLPPLETQKTETKFGVAAHFNHGDNYRSVAEVEAAVKLINDAGMSIVRKDLSIYLTESGRLVEFSGVSFDKALDIARRHDLSVLAIVGHGGPIWASSRDVDQWPHGGVSRHDSGPAQTYARLIARRWPTQSLFEIGNEPNLGLSSGFIDPVAWAEHHKAMALGIWYENPRAIIVSGSICCFGRYGDNETQYVPTPEAFADWEFRWNAWVYADGNAYLAEACPAGMCRYSDYIGIHPHPHLATGRDSNEVQLTKFLDVLESHGYGDKPLWVTETAIASWLAPNYQEHARYLVGELRYWSEHPRVQAAIIYNFRDNPPPTDTLISGIVQRSYHGDYTPKPAYWAVREFITGKPPPE